MQEREHTTRTFVIALAPLLGATTVAEAEVSVLVAGSSPQGANGLALDSRGGLRVVEEALGGCLSRVERSSGEVHVIADGLALGSVGSPVRPPRWLFSGVAVGADGAIHVTSDVASALYRIVRR